MESDVWEPWLGISWVGLELLRIAERVDLADLLYWSWEQTTETYHLAQIFQIYSLYKVLDLRIKFRNKGQ